MARKIQRLSDRTAKAKTKRGLYSDGNGLYLRVGDDSDNKSWVFRFKQKVGDKFKARDMGLGGYPTVSLADARLKAKEAWEHHRVGRDPIHERKAARDAAVAQQRLAEARGVTFRQCAEQWIEDHKAGWKNTKHRQQWVNTLVTYAYPVIGEVPVADITTEHVLKVLKPIWYTKTETASRVRGRIETVLAAAKTRGLRAGENPALWRGHLDTLLPAKSNVRTTKHHPALAYEHLPVFMARLRSRDDLVARALEVTILTALRTDEARGAEFDEFDLEANVWSVPGPRMKGGKDGDPPHRVPLCDRVIAIVKELAATKRNRFVFPGRDPGKSLSENAMLLLLHEMHTGITVHGFRSTFKDWASEQTSFADHVSEAALAHASADKVRAAYARSDLFQKRRELMEAWAKYCEPQPAADKPARHIKLKTPNGAGLVA